MVANLIVTNDAEEKLFLQEYFGQPPDPYQLARFFLMQQVVHMFYAMAFLFQGSSAIRRAAAIEDTPDFRYLSHRRLWASESG